LQFGVRERIHVMTAAADSDDDDDDVMADAGSDGYDLFHPAALNPMSFIHWSRDSQTLADSHVVCPQSPRSAHSKIQCGQLLNPAVK